MEPRLSTEQLTEQRHEIAECLKPPRRDEKETDKQFEQRQTKFESEIDKYIADRRSFLVKQRRAFEASRTIVPQVLLDSLNALNRVQNHRSRLTDVDYLTKSKVQMGDRDLSREDTERAELRKRLETLEALLFENLKK